MSVETLDPVTAEADETNGWEVAGGAASLVAALTDASDATGAQYKGLNATRLQNRLFMTWNPPAGPAAGALVESVTWRFRHAMQGTRASGVFWPSTPYGGTVITTLLGVIQDSEFTTVVPAGTLAADFATGCWIDHPLSTAKADDVRLIYEAEIDVVYFDPPSVTIDGPTGSILATSTPLIEWTVTSELDQTLAEILIYEQATANAGGFVIGQSSGLIYSASVTALLSEHSLSQAIPNDDYRVFVRTRQQVNGQDQLSAWASQDWTQNVSSPSSPTIGTPATNGFGVQTVDVTAPASSIPAVERIEVQRRIARTSAEIADAAYETVDANVVLAAGATGRFADERVPEGWQFQYRARSIAVVGGEGIASTWVTTVNTSSTWNLSPYVFLIDTAFRGTASSYLPSDGQAVRLRLAPNGIPGHARQRRWGRHDVRGRRDPIVTFDVVQYPDQIQLAAWSFIDEIADPFAFPDSYASREEIDQLLERDTVVVLKAEAELGEPLRYFVIVAHDRQRVDDALATETTRLELFTLVPVDPPAYVDGATVATP
ncbi:MAG: hypothetical protein AAGA99_21065 [Actinomycetota bacterium]